MIFATQLCGRDSLVQKSPYWVRNTIDSKTWFLFSAVMNMNFKSLDLDLEWKQCQALLNRPGCMRYVQNRCRDVTHLIGLYIRTFLLGLAI